MQIKYVALGLIDTNYSDPLMMIEVQINLSEFLWRTIVFVLFLTRMDSNFLKNRQ